MQVESLYNRKHKQGRFVLDNAFGILKKNFKIIPYQKWIASFICARCFHHLFIT
jgi:hypothetical protein